MDKLEILCSMDKMMLSDFSKRVVARVTGRTRQSIHLPFVSSYLEANITKECEKDRIIITQAARDFAGPAGPRKPDVDAIFEETKSVDRAFLKRLTIPSLAVSVHYEDIEEIRKQRIRCLAQAVHTLLAAWTGDAAFRAAVRSAFTGAEFKTTLIEILHLYNLETRKISNSIRLLPPFNAAVNYFADTLFDVMETVSEDLVGDYFHRVYEGELNHVGA